MDKKILAYESVRRERELILRLYGVTHPKGSRISIERILSEVNDPFDVLCDPYSPSAPDDSYLNTRLNTLTRLMISVANADIRDGVDYLPDERWDDKSAGALISRVNAVFELQRGEKLVAVFYSDTNKIKAVYESRAWESFGCDADNERLKQYVACSAPCKMVMVHSHPERMAVVSSDDIRFTQDIAAYAESLGSVLTEHFVLPCSGSLDDYIGIIGRERQIRYLHS